MAHNLYRTYLYLVCIAMLILASVGLGLLLQPLLALTALRGSSGTVPTSSAMVQQAVFFGVSWFIAAILGGFHYWLIRRDMQSDSAAGGSAIRAFFLNGAELIVAPLAIGAASFGVIEQLGWNEGPDLSTTAALAIATLALLGVLEWERQRARAGTNAALFFEHLHFYGVQFILLIMLAFSWNATLNLLVDSIAFGGRGTGIIPCGGFVACPGPNALSAVAATLWLVLFWIRYGFLVRDDTSSWFRRIIHYLSFALGIGFLLYGIRQGIELALFSLFGITVSANEFLGSYNFVAFISLGLLVTGVYALWMRIAAGQQPVAWKTTLLVCLAIVATLLAGAFYWGVALVFLNLLESPATLRAWSAALAFVITGIAYLVLDVHLHRRKAQDIPGATDARRGFVFALLGGATLTVAIGGAFALYAVITSALGSPLTDWPHVARSGAAAFAVGVVMLGIYLWLAGREHLFSGLLKRTATTESHAIPEPGAQAMTVEAILDRLLAGKISRDEAVTNIHQLLK